MKMNLLLLLLTSILCFPTAQAQLLTEIQEPDEVEIERSKFYIPVGYYIRQDLGYDQMRDFYQGLGFDDIESLQLNPALGFGYLLGDRFSAELLGEFGFQSDQRDLSDGTELSMSYATLGLHGLIGYSILQGNPERQFQNLVLQTGLSGIITGFRINEQAPGNFDFENPYASGRPIVNSWPTVSHTQAALHLALQFKFRTPRALIGGSDLDLTLGYVSGLQDKSWSVDPAQGLNTPVDRAQYLYMRATYHIFFRKPR